jgi:Cytochrome c554 and c-prime
MYPAGPTSAQRRILATAAAATALCLAAALAGAAPAPGPSAEDQQCLACHGQEGMTKSFAKGDPVSLHVEGRAFAASVHGPLGCAACHGDVDLKDHPGAGKPFATAREFSIAMVGACGQCHEDKAKLFEGSVHAGILRTGNLAAPVCTDCHGVHAIARQAAAPVANDVACRKCHQDIFDAYLKSPHGQAFGKPGPLKAPICADCHRAHDVSPAATGTGLRDACLGCHASAVEAHAKWLPNTKLHLEVVSCPACHAPTSQKSVDLRLYDPVAKRDVTAKEGQPPLDAKALSDLVRGVNRDGTPGKMTLVGRLEVRSGAEAHQLTGKGEAIKDCVVCHRKGADPFQNVTISIVGPDGRPVRFEAQQDVLHRAQSVDALPGFYAIGGTRIGVLDLLLALALLAGISAPIAHFVLRRLLRRKQAAADGKRE